MGSQELRRRGESRIHTIPCVRGLERLSITMKMKIALPYIKFRTSTMVTKSGCLQKKSIITGLAQRELRCSAEQSPRTKTVANAACLPLI